MKGIVNCNGCCTRLVVVCILLLNKAEVREKGFVYIFIYDFRCEKSFSLLVVLSCHILGKHCLASNRNTWRYTKGMIDLMLGLHKPSSSCLTTLFLSSCGKLVQSRTPNISYASSFFTSWNFFYILPSTTFHAPYTIPSCANTIYIMYILGIQ